MFTAAAILAIKYREIILQLNQYVFGHSLDAQKSYFNFSWYLRYGEGLNHTGINYPHGDHLHFINSHPAYLYLLKPLESIISFGDYGVGFINLTMLLSIILAVPFIYLILREFNLPRWYAAVFAILIQFLYPQFDRIAAHFEMVVAYIIPAYWYFLIRFQRAKEHQWIWAVLMVFIASWGGFIGAYLVAICSLFCLAFILVKIIAHRTSAIPFMKKKGLALLLVAILPLVLVKGFVDMTDWVIDRPGDPWGFYIFTSNIWSIFLPENAAIRSLFGDWWFQYKWEGRAYVGLVSVCMSFLLLGTIIYHILKKKQADRFFVFRNTEINHFLAAGTIVLLYSMGLPFKWGLESIPEAFPILKQFRSLGRFSWVFYYCLSIFSSYYFYSGFRLLKRYRSVSLAYALLGIVMIQWSIDAKHNLDRSHDGEINTNNYIHPDNSEHLANLQAAGFNPEDFQALLCIPFQQTNGDKMMFDNGHRAFKTMMSYSLHTGIPIIQSFSPRISFSQSMGSIQLLANDCIEKKRLQKMDDRPILVVAAKDKKRPVEDAFLSQTRRIFDHSTHRLHVLYLDSLTIPFQRCADRVHALADSLTNEFFSVPDTAAFIYRDFEGESSTTPRAFTGTGGKSLRKGELILIDTTFGPATYRGKLEFSFWMYNDIEHVAMPDPFLDVFDENGKLIRSTYLRERMQHDVTDYWIRISGMETLHPDHRYRLRMKGEYITVDDLLIRHLKDEILIRRPEGKLLYNNYIFDI